MILIDQCEGVPDGEYTFGTCQGGKLIDGYAPPAQQYYEPGPPELPPNPCPRGDRYPKPANWPFKECDYGYMGQIGGEDCLCLQGQNVPSEIKKINRYEQGKETIIDTGTDEFKRWLPIAIIGFIILFLLGGKR